MNPHRITRKLEFDAGHRLLNHEGKCRNYHGHRYVVEVTCTADDLDAVGRVVDFAVVKARVGGWIDAELDHGMILEADDPLRAAFAAQGTKVHVVAFPPTAEHLARYLVDAAARVLDGTGVRVAHVRLYETPNCWADAGAP